MPSTLKLLGPSRIQMHRSLLSKQGKLPSGCERYETVALTTGGMGSPFPQCSLMNCSDIPNCCVSRGQWNVDVLTPTSLVWDDAGLADPNRCISLSSCLQESNHTSHWLILVHNFLWPLCQWLSMMTLIWLIKFDSLLNRFGNADLSQVNVLFQFVEVIHIHHLPSKLNAIKQNKITFKIEFISQIRYGFGPSTHLIAGRKTCQTMRMKLVGWTR